MRRSLIVASLIVVGATRALAQGREMHAHRPGQRDELGEVSFANSGARAAQAPFLRGLALLHSFEYEQAAESFRAAQQADPGFAMSYWGEALTYTHGLWGEDDPASARRALQRLAPTRAARLATAGTPRERAYGDAIEGFFADADLPARVHSFAQGMRQLSAQYPDDVDAAAFTALALMLVDDIGGGPASEREAARSEAITIAERVFRTHPKHPGSTHYLIHAADDPAFAARGLSAARTYAAIAPDAEHALHMPSHIFLQLGLWQDVVSSNERAWVASRAEVLERKLSGADLSFHTLQWLQYGYLQQGRYAAARALIDTARAVLAGTDLSKPDYADARYTVGTLEFAYATHSGNITPELCRRAHSAPVLSPPVSERERSFQTTASLQTAVTAALCGDTNAPSIQSLRERVSGLPAADPARRALETGLVQVDALLAERAGDDTRVVELITPLTRTPARPPVGPPALPRTYELLGAALLHAGRAQDAARAYEQALQLTPKRSEALLGLARARAAQGDRAGAAAAYRELLVNWEHADRNAPALGEVRKGASL